MHALNRTDRCTVFVTVEWEYGIIHGSIDRLLLRHVCGSKQIRPRLFEQVLMDKPKLPIPTKVYPDYRTVSLVKYYGEYSTFLFLITM